MIIEFYGKGVRFIARAILRMASVLALLIFVIDVITLFSDEVEHAPPIAFIVTPIMGLASYYASRLFVPLSKENTEDITGASGST
jgi:hypothetical protein